MQTIIFRKPPIITANYTVVGPKEGKGPLGESFDVRLTDDKNNQKTYEKGESSMQLMAIRGALSNCNKTESDIGALIAGDLVNEIIASSFAAKDLDVPFLGVYNACSTFAEALIIGSSLVTAGLIDTAACMSSSHFSTVERQFRYPLELGTQPTPTSQWTVTGAGCSILSSEGDGPKVECATIGKVIDMGVNDANNMGGAMAPAAVDTIRTHLQDTGRSLDYYDMVFTGDLGKFGNSLARDLLTKEGIAVGDNFNDCGAIIFGNDPKVTQGGSGAGCVSVVFNGHLVKQMREKNLNKLLLVPTGALLSKVSSLQGESIPCIAHAISVIS